MKIPLHYILFFVLPFSFVHSEDLPEDNVASPCNSICIPIRSTDPLKLPLDMLYMAHPWHGIPLGADAPDVVNCYVEIVPSDTLKYEIDKDTGILKIDRPQKYSSLSPSLYGFIPRTLAGDRVGDYMQGKTGNQKLKGDGDAIDICILTENHIVHGGFIARARPIGGFRMIDDDEADDKIIAILEGDLTYGAIQDINECPEKILERLRHYFLSYKNPPGNEKKNKVAITEIYGKEEALEVIRRGYDDYLEFISPFYNIRIP